MTVSLQIISLLINFIYGFILFYLAYLNYIFIKKEPILVKFLITILFMLDYFFVYIIIFYKLTNGVLHIFYLFLFVLGFYLGYILKVSNVYKKGLGILHKWLLKNKK